MEHVTDTNKLQEETVAVSRAQYEALQAENVELTQQVKWLMEQMRLMRIILL
jgi:cell division protein FtsB